MHPTPWHFWIVVTLGVVWHLIGVVDYTSIQYDWQPWLTMMSGRQTAFVQTMPDWVDGAWALSAWVGLLGVLLLAARMSFAPVILAISMLATVVVAVWLSLFSNPPVLQLAGWPALATLWIAVAFTVLLWLSARDMHKSGVIA